MPQGRAHRLRASPPSGWWLAAGGVLLFALASGAVVLLRGGTEGSAGAGGVASPVADHAGTGSESRPGSVPATWSAQTHDETRVWPHGVVLDGDTLFIGAGGAVVALDVASGEIRWSWAYPRAVGSPVVTDDTVVLLGGEELTALNREDGSERWSTRTDLGSFGQMAAAGGGLLHVAGWVGHPQGKLAAYDVRSGAERWRLDFGPALVSGPVRVGDGDGGLVAIGLHIGPDTDGLRLVEAASGRVVGAVATAGVRNPPVAADGIVYASTEAGTVVAVDTATREVLWETDVGASDAIGQNELLASPVVAGDVLVVGVVSYDARFDQDGVVHVLDRASGRRLRTAIVPGELSAPPAARDGLIAVATGGGDVHAVDVATGEIEWTADVGEARAAPVFAGDAVLVVGTDGTVWWLDAASGGAFRRLALATWGTGSVQPDVVGDAVVTAGPSLTVRDVASGDVRWELPTDEWFSDAEAEGHIAYALRGSFLRAFDLAGGEELWSTPTPGIGHRLTVRGGTAYVATSVGLAALAVDANDSEVLWQAELGAAVVATPLVVDDVVYATDAVGQVHALAADTGTPLWRAAVAACTPPASTDDVVAVGTRRGVVALRAVDGSQLWRSPEAGPGLTGAPPICAPLAAGDGRIHVARLLGGLTTYGAATGRYRWSTGLAEGAVVTSPPTLAAGRLLVGGSDGVVRAFDSEEGDLLGRVAVSSPFTPVTGRPLVVGGALYVTAADGLLHRVPAL